MTNGKLTSRYNLLSVILITSILLLCNGCAPRIAMNIAANTMPGYPLVRSSWPALAKNEGRVIVFRARLKPSIPLATQCGFAIIGNTTYRPKTFLYGMFYYDNLKAGRYGVSCSKSKGSRSSIQILPGKTVYLELMQPGYKRNGKMLAEVDAAVAEKKLAGFNHSFTQALPYHLQPAVTGKPAPEIAAVERKSRHKSVTQKHTERIAKSNQSIDLTVLKKGLLKSGDIRGLFSGNTVEGFHENKQFAFVRYYGPDGSMIERRKSGRTRQGKWSVRGHQLCENWKKESKRRSCRAVRINGNVLIKYKNHRGKETHVVTYKKFTQGNLIK